MSADPPTATHDGLDPAATVTRRPAAADLLTLTCTADPLPAPTDFRLPTGTLLDGRYRVVAPLGRGGMGEVYRADDLHLGVAVALKFLPATTATDPVKLDRLRKEVASARQVSHPHVCRVFDIGAADGHAFLSMEFIPGADLAAVLAKVGRLAPDVACDLGRQIALGLHAVHDEGLVHRDLKPANVMVDGRGRARLTDFGLATAEDVSGVEAMSGTPAYQAPEQLAGGSVMERTDVYALGAVVYELLTGTRPVVARSRAELREAQKSPPAKPSALVPGVGPEVDRIVLKCLSFDPKDRPASAHEVWRALPGDAALNAALAAGQTPTAEAVADAGGEGRLSRRTALLLAAWVMLAAGLAAVMNDWATAVRVTPIRSPAELRQAANDHLRLLGPAVGVADTAGELNLDGDQWNWWMANVRTADRLDALAAGRPTFVRYFYRENPVPMLPPPRASSAGVVMPTEPPLGLPGSALVWVDGPGRLLAVERVRPLGRLAAGGEPDWRPLFAAAGLEPAAFAAAEPAWEWIVPDDRRAAWQGVYPERPDIPLRVEAAADRGEPVGFRLVAPWTRPDVDEMTQAARTDPVRFQVARFLFPGLMVVAGVVLTVTHVRAGRADLRGAFRFALVFGAVHFANHLVWFHPVGGLTDYAQLYGSVARVLLNAVVLAVGYVALEPFVRRYWPGRLVGWSRLLAGRVFDPRIGREVLTGVAIGAAASLLVKCADLPVWPGLPPEGPAPTLIPVEWPVRSLLSMALTAFDGSLTVLFVAFVLARLLRTAWLWVPVLLALTTAGFMVGPATNPVIYILLGTLGSALALTNLLRFGLLSGAVGSMGALIVFFYPLTYAVRPWYATSSAVGFAALGTMTLFGLLVSVGGWRGLVRPPTTVH